MTAEAAGLTPEQADILSDLAATRTRVLAAAQEGTVDLAHVRRVADHAAALTPRLLPMPIEPSAHVRAAHAHARPYLERLGGHQPAHEVVADAAHRYTPRKVLRRVLDHALDHLSQIEQWLIWQEQEQVPTPRDGWATSGETLPEDLRPLTKAELHAWLWRIDLAVDLVAQRAEYLDANQLDWAPPDGGWTLRRMLHHLACAEVYYAIWLDEALPDETVARYHAASWRFERSLHRTFSLPSRAHVAHFSPDDGAVITVEQIGRLLLDEERRLHERQH